MMHFNTWASTIETLLIARQVLAVPYSEYILAPKSRTVRPASVYNVNGTVANAEALTEEGSDSPATFNGESAVTYDFGLNTAGIVSFTVDSVSGSSEFIGVSFTESSLWINSEGCDATQDAGIDEALWFPVSVGTFSAHKEHQRGGFRYMNVYHNTTGSVSISTLWIQFTAVPQLQEDQIANYTGYFNSNDEKLNRVWYAGAYTNQLCTIDPTAGDSLIYLGQINSTSNVTEPLPWYLNYTISNGSSVLVDGAKRDRLVWPGDIAISGPSMIVSTYDISTIRDSLNSLLDLQNPVTGQLPYAGRPFGERLGAFSFTYHLYSLIDIADYYLYTGDISYLSDNWNRFKLGLNYSLSQIDDSGLMNVTSSADWLRFGMGGHNIEANCILYYTLTRATSLATALNDSSVLPLYASSASTLKSAAQSLLWDASASLFRDNETATLHPQDGNVWAILANITSSASQNALISSALASRWTPYGPPAIEAADAISPFISGFEIQAHFKAGRADRALQLIRCMWADFMLDDPRMTNSTFVEGYASDGALRYAPYTNDARISHAHGWATGPTAALTFYVAGINLLTPTPTADNNDGGNGGGGGGNRNTSTWLMAPNPADLRTVDAGFDTTLLGSFSAQIATQDGVLTSYNFSTPPGTTGKLSVPYPRCGGVMTVRALDVDVDGQCGDFTVDVDVDVAPLPLSGDGGAGGGNGNGMMGAAEAEAAERIEVDGLKGGRWSVGFACGA